MHQFPPSLASSVNTRHRWFGGRSRLFLCLVVVAAVAFLCGTYLLVSSMRRPRIKNNNNIIISSNNDPPAFSSSGSGSSVNAEESYKVNAIDAQAMNNDNQQQPQRKSDNDIIISKLRSDVDDLRQDEEKLRDQVHRLESDMLKLRRELRDQQQQQQQQVIPQQLPVIATKPTFEMPHLFTPKQQQQQEEQQQQNRQEQPDQKKSNDEQQRPVPVEEKSTKPPRPFDDIADLQQRNTLRRNLVKDSFLEAWQSYEKYAWGRDELRPDSRGYYNWGKRNSAGIGLTIYDSLSTLAVMGLDRELKNAIGFVASDVARQALDQDAGISVFETMIRVVGPLLSAYELTDQQHPQLLAAAKRVADKLLFAFNTSSGLPHQMVNLKTGQHWNPEWLGDAAILSEFGSVQLELRTLSFHTKDPIYDQIATHIMSIIHNRCDSNSRKQRDNENGGRGGDKNNNKDFLCSIFASVEDGQFRDDKITLGALGDSYFEILLKQFILTGGEEPVYGAMAQNALDSVIEKLLRKSSGPSKLSYLISLEQGGVTESHNFDELACFSGGMFALASKTIGHKKFNRREVFAFAGNNNNNDASVAKGDSNDGGGDGAGDDQQLERTDRYFAVAEELTRTCYEMYERQPTGLAPESVTFRSSGNNNNKDFYDGGDQKYVLRPETLESLFYMWRFTQNETYREMAWDIFSSIHRFCRNKDGTGFSGLKMVSLLTSARDDRQQSFFLAETLKYLFLIFSDNDNGDGSSNGGVGSPLLVPLDKWVFTTEAHPLKIRPCKSVDLWQSWEDENSNRNAEGAQPRWMPPFVQDLRMPGSIPQIFETTAQRARRKFVPRVRAKDPLAIDDPKLDE